MGDGARFTRREDGGLRGECQRWRLRLEGGMAGNDFTRRRGERREELVVSPRLSASPREKTLLASICIDFSAPPLPRPVRIGHGTECVGVTSENEAPASPADGHDVVAELRIRML